MEKNNETSERKKVPIRGYIVFAGMFALAYIGAYFANYQENLSREATRQLFSPVRAEIVDANNDKYPDLRILNQGGAEYILYGDANEDKWLDKEDKSKEYKSKLEELSKKYLKYGYRK